MGKSRSPWQFILSLGLIVAILGVGFGLRIVQREGWKGRWHRKKELIKEVQPDAAPFIDNAEKRLR